MPGILPMKVIKVGNSAQSRVAQACDRCRSKKIRCDGVRPTCSQCALVGFECRTSDKLSRRAFPRGYTESLEERVRSLEAEVRELKDLLDEKDEKIDILSAMHHGAHRHGRTNALSGASSSSSSSSSLSLSSSSIPSPASSNTTANGSSPPPPKDSPAAKKTCFRVQATQLLLGIENSDSYFMGSSSGRAFIASLKHKIRESGKPGGDFNPDAFLHIQGCAPLDAAAPDKLFRIPPRLFSDRCVNVFFQEWAPLFPILHRPTFLRIYDEFVNDVDKVKYDFKLAQLYLVFSIAGLSLETPDIHLVANCERRWTKALESLAIENTMDTLQCLILAILYCAMRADYRRLQHYKSIAVGLSHRLGLHQSQKRFSFGALTLETRKKVFWSLYALDCFTAATLGLPKLLKDEDVQAEYPSDADDEYITEKGFRPTLPGEYTRISSALALFRASRVLARVLEKNYPAPTNYELSLEQMGALESELDAWYNGLPQHLRLGFAHGKLSTDVTGSRSPLLALAYYYIKTLIYRPVVGSSLGAEAAPALMTISTCSKHMIQISQLLEERSMSFSFCVNKGDMLAMCGLTLLYQAIDMGQESKLVQESTRLIKEVLKTMHKMKSPGLVDLERAAQGVVNVGTCAVHATTTLAPATGITITHDTARNRAAAPSTTAATSTTPSTPTTCSSTTNTKPKTRRKPHSPAALRRSLTLTDATRIDSSGCLKSHHRCQSSMSETTVDTAKAGEMDAEEEARLHALRMLFKSRPGAATSGSASGPGLVSGSRFAGYGRPNLDYLELQHCQAQSKVGDGASRPVAGRCSLGGQPSTQTAPTTSAMRPVEGQVMAKSAGISHTEWESLLGVMEGGPDNVHNAIYGGASMLFSKTSLVGGASGSSGNAGQEWSSPESWELSGISIGELAGKSAAAQSVLSMSEESLSSGEEMPSELGMRSSVGYQKPLQGFQLDDLDSFLL